MALKVIDEKRPCLQKVTGSAEVAVAEILAGDEMPDRTCFSFRV